MNKLYYSTLILFLILFSAVTNAIPQELQWLSQLDSKTQSPLILLIRNNINTKIKKELDANAFSREEQDLVTHRSSLYIQTLSSLTKESRLKRLLKTESELLGDMFVLGSNNSNASNKYTKNLNVINKEFLKYSRNDLMNILKKYKPLLDPTISAIIKYGKKVQKETLNKNHVKKSLSEVVSDQFELLIKQNNGVIRAASATYLVSTYHNNNEVVLNYQIREDELIEAAIKEKGMSEKQAKLGIKSKDFMLNLESTYSTSMKNYYCNFKGTKAFITEGGALIINFAFDTGKPLTDPIRVDGSTCLISGNGT